jgi:carbohydrate-selective porin OprB
MWFEQSLFNEKLSIRFGKLAADTEFMFADSAGAFIASTFGWTTLSSDNLPFGGPIYPFASPGVRVSVKPNDRLTLMTAVYDDDPIGPCAEDLDPGQCNKHGLEFRLEDTRLCFLPKLTTPITRTLDYPARSSSAAGMISACSDSHQKHYRHRDHQLDQAEAGFVVANRGAAGRSFSHWSSIPGRSGSR